MDTSRITSSCDEKRWIPCFSRSTVMLLLALFSILPARTISRVIGGKLDVVQRETTVLPCQLVENDESITQISWQKKTRQKPWNQNFFTISSKNEANFVNGGDARFKFIGNVANRDGSLQFSNITLLDEGTYRCIFTLFPSGNQEAEISLNVSVPPISSLEGNSLMLGSEEVALVTCTASGSRPLAVITWQFGHLEGKVRVTNKTTNNEDGTSTTVSSLFGVPTKEINNHAVQCVVTNPAISKEEVLPFTIQVYFSPLDVIIEEQADGSFQCVAEANPPANITWRSTGTSVTVEGNALKRPDQNGVYQCEASNVHGKRYGHLYVHVTSGTCTTAWVLFFLLLIVLLSAVGWYLHKSGTLQSFISRIREGESREREQPQQPHGTSESDGSNHEAVPMNPQP